MNNYYTWLDAITAKKAQDWSLPPMLPLSTDEVYTLMLNDPTYNYLIFYENNPYMANQMLYSNPDAHFDDIGKTMYHPTFSDQSIYSGKVSDYNPYGIVGGSWGEDADGQTYTPSISLLNNYWDYNTTKKYLDNNEEHPVKIIIPKYQTGKDDDRSKYWNYVATLGPSLYRAMSRRGIQNIDNFYDHAMKQMASESKFGQSDAARNGYNFGGVKPRTKYTKYKSVDDYTEKWVDMMLRMFPNAVTATTPKEYVTALTKNVEGHPYFEDSVDNYLRNIQNATTLDAAMRNYRERNKALFTTSAGVDNGNLVQPIFKSNGDILKSIEVPIQPEIRTVLNPFITIPRKPELYPMQQQSYDTELYNRGKSGIHINPANRGKFNATKKRTGKSTEELAHSKNPLTRRRAIFAQNARKWKH